MEGVHVPGCWRRQLAALFRWLHIYLSMASFAILFFFAATGLTLNHSEWFEGIVPPRTSKQAGQLDARWVAPGAAGDVDRLEIVEFLRSRHGIRAALGDFEVGDAECDLSFRGPGYTADVFVDRSNGQYELTEMRMGFFAIVNDLHKGRDTGGAWSWVIDISAALMILVSLTGLTLIFFLKRRRFTGLFAVAAGAAICLGVYRFLVP